MHRLCIQDHLLVLQIWWGIFMWQAGEMDTTWKNVGDTYSSINACMRSSQSVRTSRGSFAHRNLMSLTFWLLNRCSSATPYRWSRSLSFSQYAKVALWSVVNFTQWARRWLSVPACPANGFRLLIFTVNWKLARGFSWQLTHNYRGVTFLSKGTVKQDIFRPLNSKFTINLRII